MKLADGEYVGGETPGVWKNAERNIQPSQPGCTQSEIMSRLCHFWWIQYGLYPMSPLARMVAGLLHLAILSASNRLSKNHWDHVRD